MRNVAIALAALLAAAPLSMSLAHAEDTLLGGVADLGAQADSNDGDRLDDEIVTATPEGQEDCEALRESLRSQRDDNRLIPADFQELRRSGC